LVRELLRICAAREVDLVVIGMPVSADGAEGPGCERARRIRRNLDEAGVRVELQDEAWTSRGAEAILRAVGKKREKAKAKIDAVAASLILRDHLDGTASV
jgi:putative Holliday junction resolvase